MHLTIGSAPDSWGVWFGDDARQTPWHRFLDEIAEAGYEWTELGPFGYLPTDPKTLKQEIDKRGLKVTGSFVEGDLSNPDTSGPGSSGSCAAGARPSTSSTPNSWC